MLTFYVPMIVYCKIIQYLRIRMHLTPLNNQMFPSGIFAHGKFSAIEGENFEKLQFFLDIFKKIRTNHTKHMISGIKIQKR